MPMTVSEAGKLGAAKTNSILTKKQRSLAAKKAWITKRKKKAHG